MTIQSPNAYKHKLRAISRDHARQWRETGWAELRGVRANGRVGRSGSKQPPSNGRTALGVPYLAKVERPPPKATTPANGKPAAGIERLAKALARVYSDQEPDPGRDQDRGILPHSLFTFMNGGVSHNAPPHAFTVKINTNDDNQPVKIDQPCDTGYKPAQWEPRSNTGIKYQLVQDNMRLLLQYLSQRGAWEEAFEIFCLIRHDIRELHRSKETDEAIHAHLQAAVCDAPVQLQLL
jgi:hypothetical protein